MNGDKITNYRLVRKKDIHGISGIGTVGVISVFPSGRACMEWVASNHVTFTIFNNLHEIELIHGHNGASVIEPLNGPINEDE